LLISICTFLIFTHAQWRIYAPAENRYCVFNPAGETIIPNGRIIKPLGKTYRIAPHPYGMAMSLDGKTKIAANSGTNPFSISILQDIFTGKPKIT
jgi:DNA-binding beta-propeller fold protein YncE